MLCCDTDRRLVSIYGVQFLEAVKERIYDSIVDVFLRMPLFLAVFLFYFLLP